MRARSDLTGLLCVLHAWIVIGAATDRAADLLKAIYLPLTSGEYYNTPGAVPGPRDPDAPPPILLTSTKAAEIIKRGDRSSVRRVSIFCGIEAADNHNAVRIAYRRFPQKHAVHHAENRRVDRYSECKR